MSLSVSLLASLSMHLSLYLCVSLSLSVCLSLSSSLSLSLSICLSPSLSLSASLFVFLYLSVYLWVSLCLTLSHSLLTFYHTSVNGQQLSYFQLLMAIADNFKKFTIFVKNNRFPKNCDPYAFMLFILTIHLIQCISSQISLYLSSDHFFYAFLSLRFILSLSLIQLLTSSFPFSLSIHPKSSLLTLNVMINWMEKVGLKQK